MVNNNIISCASFEPVSIAVWILENLMWSLPKNKTDEADDDWEDGNDLGARIKSNLEATEAAVHATGTHGDQMK